MSHPGSRIRFLCDEDFNGDVVKGLRRVRSDMDILTAPEAGTMGLDDPQVLAYAADHGRTLLSHDSRTMPTHFATFLVTGHHSPGLIIVCQALPIGKAIQEVLLI
jgi:hypothetical protein